MTGAVDAVFIDTSVLVYATIQGAPWHEEAITAIQHLRAKSIPLWVSRQVLREYAAVVTRPQTFAAPLTAQALAADIQLFEAQFHVADETAAVTTELVRLLQLIRTRGKQIHDANIVATMLVNRVPCLLTHNTADFARFSAHIAVQSLIPAA